MKDGMTQRDNSAANQPRTLFKPTAWLAKIDFINHLILFNNVLIAVLSEKEGGKTCFSTLLQSNLDQQIKSLTMTLTPPCETKAFIEQVATQLHLNHDDHTNIASLAAQINEREAHVLLVIDNAQHLPESLTKEIMLAIKGQESFGFFHVCLVSDYSIVANLNQLAADQFNNLIHTIELGSLNESETRTYVLQRAMNANLINRPLTDEQFKQFYQLTKGNLAKINSDLEAFIDKCSVQKKGKKLNTVKKVGFALSAVTAAVVSYIYFDLNAPTIPTVTTPVTKTASATDRLGNIFKRAPANLTQTEPMVSQIPSWLDSSSHQFVYFSLPKKELLAEEESLFPEEEININAVAVRDRVLVIPEFKPLDESAEKTTSAEKPKPVAEKQENKPATEQVIANKPSLNTVGAYTIQLAASHTQSDVDRFKKSNQLLADAKVRHFTNAKGSWYILTLGEFANRNQAQVEVSKLPKSLTKLNPWVRSVSGLDNVG